MKEIFPGVFQEQKRIYTQNTTPGMRFYGESLVSKNKHEYREWVPSRSKFGAAICNNLASSPFLPTSTVLYIGASTGTTVSHISDIVTHGVIYGIEFAERVFRNLLALAEKRKNTVPVFADARNPDRYHWIECCDVVFADIAQSDEVEIALRNADIFLKLSGTLLIALKSQSIDVTKKPQDVYTQAKKKIEDAGYHVTQIINLEPYEKKHAMVVGVKT